MAKSDIPGARRLSAKAKEVWLENTTAEQLPNFRQVVFNVVHEYCFFICTQAACDGCNVAKMRSWVANVKELPQNMSVPVIRDLNVKSLKKAESKIKPITVERSDAPEHKAGKSS
jgi:hypothetical protein